MVRPDAKVVLVGFGQREPSSHAAALRGLGRVVDAIGDAVLVTTPTPEAALRYLGRLFDLAAGEQDFPVLRAGLHHGGIVERDGLFFGATLNLAARVAAHARGGQILATASVEAAATAEGFEVATLGVVTFKNIREPVEIFTLRRPGLVGAERIDPVCRMRVEPESAAAATQCAARHQNARRRPTRKNGSEESFPASSAMSAVSPVKKR